MFASKIRFGEYEKLTVIRKWFYVDTLKILLNKMLGGTDTNTFMVNDTKFNEFMQPEILLEGDRSSCNQRFF